MADVFRHIAEFPNPRPWRGIVIHHSTTLDGQVKDWDAIRQWHIGKIGDPNPKSSNYNPYIKAPMHDVGYHYGLEMVNGRLEYMIGRPLSWEGGHTKGMNDVLIGICVVGDFDLAEPTHQQYFMLSALCRELMRRFDIPRHGVSPHWAFADKTCPGRRFDMLKLRDYCSGEAKA